MSETRPAASDEGPRDRQGPGNDTPPSTGKRALARRLVLLDGMALLFVALGAAIYLAADALLLLFACVLFAVLLDELGGVLQRHTRLGHKSAIAVVVLALLAVIGLGSWAMAPQIAEQSTELAKQLPAAIERLQQMVNEHPLLKRLAGALPQPQEITRYLGQMVPNAGLFFGGVLGAIGNVVIIVVVGIYFAASPGAYIRGFVKLLPQSKRARATEVLQRIGKTLARWLLGKAISMLIVGVTTSVGLTLMGVPLGMILGIIAGLLDFIPYLGPIMAGVPAVLIALSMGPDMALYTILLFLAVQLVEGYVLQPLIEARAVEIAPALVIVMQLIFGSIFGFAGIALATPLTAALMVMVQMLYVEDVLGDRAKEDSG